LEYKPTDDKLQPTKAIRDKLPVKVYQLKKHLRIFKRLMEAAQMPLNAPSNDFYHSSQEFHHQMYKN